MSWLEIDPLPTQFWLRWAPRRPPAAEQPFVDPASRRLVWEEGDGTGRELPSGPPPAAEATLLPPPSPAVREACRGLNGALAAARVPVVRQQIAGEPADSAADGGGVDAARLLDLLALLLEGRGGLARLAALERPRGTLWILFPLLPGVVSAAEELDDWLEGLTRLEPDAVVGVAPELEPSDRRRLVARVAEERFEAVFHGRPRSETELARAAAAFGLPVLPARPALPGLAPRAERNRALATTLAECGDLQIRLGQSEVEGASLLAAARHLERTPYDVAALTREGHLELLEWLSGGARRIVEASVAGEGEPALEAIRRLWRGPVA